MRFCLRIVLITLMALLCLVPVDAQEQGTYLSDSAHYLELGKRYQDKNRRYKDEYNRRLDIALKLDYAGEAEAALFWLGYSLKAPAATNANIVNSYGWQSTIYQKLGRYDKAMEVNVAALKYATTPKTITKIKLNVSEIYAQVQNYQKALETLDEAMPLLSREKDTVQLIHAYTIRGMINKQMRDYPSFLASNKKAAEIARNLDHYHNNIAKRDWAISIQAITMNNVADAYLSLGMPDSALACLNNTVTYIPELSMYNRAVIFTSFGEAFSLKNQTGYALEYFSRGLAIAEEKGYFNIKTTAYKALAGLYAKNKDYHNAWDFASKYQSTLETQGAENLDKVNYWQERYNAENKKKETVERELQLSQNRLELTRVKNQRYLLIILVSCAAVIIIVSLRNIRNKRRLLQTQVKNAAQERALAETEAMLVGEERERIRIARELHDSVVTELLITRLNIANLAIGFPELKQCNDFRNILLQSDNIAEQLRQTAHNMMPAQINEAGITEAIKRFISNIRLQNLKLSFQSYGSPGLLPERMEKMLFFIVKELIQNIIKHSYASEALIQLNFYDDGFSLTVEDNGVGISGNLDSGWGLRHIRKEIDLLEGKIDIKGSEYTGTTIFIEVPYKILLPA